MTLLLLLEACVYLFSWAHNSPLLGHGEGTFCNIPQVLSKVLHCASASLLATRSSRLVGLHKTQQYNIMSCIIMLKQVGLYICQLLNPSVDSPSSSNSPSILAKRKKERFDHFSFTSCLVKPKSLSWVKPRQVGFTAALYTYTTSPPLCWCCVRGSLILLLFLD